MPKYKVRAEETIYAIYETEINADNKKSATADAKQYYYDWNKDVKWVLYKSSFHGFRAERQEDINNIYA